MIKFPSFSKDFDTTSSVAGQVKYDESIQKFKLFDGNVWVTIQDDDETEAAKLERLCQRYPALQEAREKFETLKGLYWE